MADATIVIEDLASSTPDKKIKVVKVTGQLDESNVDEKIKEVYKLVEETPKGLNIIFDFEGLEYMNSKSIGYLTDIYGKVNGGGGLVAIAKAKANIIDILQVVGLTQLIQSFGSMDEAKSHVETGTATPTPAAPTPPAAPTIAPPAVAAPTEPAPVAPATEAPQPEAAPVNPVPDVTATVEAPAAPAPEPVAEATPEPVTEPAPEVVTPAPEAAPTPEPAVEAPAEPAPTPTPEAAAAPAEPAPEVAVPPAAPEEPNKQ